MRTCVNATLDGVLSGDAHNPRTFYLSEESNEHKIDLAEYSRIDLVFVILGIYINFFASGKYEGR